MKSYCDGLIIYWDGIIYAVEDALNIHEFDAAKATFDIETKNNKYYINIWNRGNYQCVEKFLVPYYFNSWEDAKSTTNDLEILIYGYHF